MTNTPYTKFGFDTEFFELVQGANGGAGAAPSGHAMPTTTAQLKAQLEDARQQSYSEGYAAGMAEGQQQAQADLAQLQQHLQNTLMTLQTALTEREEQMVTQVLSLMRVTLHHVIGQAASAYAPEVLEHHLRALLPLLATDEALTLKIHPAARGYHEKLGLPQAAIMGLPMHVVNDPTLGPTDALVQWNNGGVESKLAQHLDAVDVMLAGAGAQMLPVEHKTNLNPLPEPVPVIATPRQPVTEPVPSGMPELDEAARAAKARANALLGDDDDDLVDALK